MATNQSPAVLARTASEKDLQRVAKSVGANWEMFGPYLLKENAMATVNHIKEDHHKTEMRIYSLLLTWKQEASPDTTLGHLFHQMLQVGTSVTVEWRTIAKYLDIEEREIRACKLGYQPPVQESSTNQIHDTDMQHLTQRPIQATQEVDGRSVPEEAMEGVEEQGSNDVPKDAMEVVKEQGNNDVQTAVDGHQTSEPSLSDRWNSKAYRPPKDTCIFDGRLIKLGEKDIADLEKNCTIQIGKGAFGKVFTSRSESKGFGINIAVKKTPLDVDAVSQSVRREMITSRIMHPFILPLLAVVDLPRKSEFWFVSPFFKKGDLCKAIKNDREGTVVMNAIIRVKILLHIALAIHYIHTGVPNVRDVIFHKDISSKNVVLDDSFNARLIDFGLAREKDDKTTSTAGSMYYTHPKLGSGKSYTESWDYHMFAVIIREMLTGLGPEGQGNTFLKNMKSVEVLDKIEKRIWSKTSTAAKSLHDIAEQFIPQDEQANDNTNQQANDNTNQCVWTSAKFKTNVVAKIKGIWNDFNRKKILDVPDDCPKCHICVINPTAKKTSMTQIHEPNCRQEIKVCIACEKNSFLNPITCYCGATLTPIIGSRCGALLVAGNDTDNKSLTEAMAKDVEELKNLITSHAPRVMGISESNVRTVLPSIPDKTGNAKPGKEPEQLWPQVKEHIKFFSKGTEVETLLLYFSCHGENKGGTGDVENQNVFRLGSAADTITLADFEKELESLGNIDKLIIILDRCYPPIIRFKSRDRKFIQINACAVNEKADINDTGSVFTKYFIQGLKANSERKRCPDNCQHCDSYWSNRSDFISVSSLIDYVSNHMKNKKRPVFQMRTDFPNIAFYTDEEVIIEFTCDQEEKGVPLEYLRTMIQLEDKLFETFKQDNKTSRVKIQRDTYRKDKRVVDCDTLEKVMWAWVLRQPLTVTFETLG